MPWSQHLTAGGDELSIVPEAGLVAGVDTHRDTHSAAMIEISIVKISSAIAPLEIRLW